MRAPEVAFLRAQLAKRWRNEAAADRAAELLSEIPDASLGQVEAITGMVFPCAVESVSRQRGQAAYEALRGAQLVAAAVVKRTA
jgi:hypothetical protein